MNDFPRLLIECRRRFPDERACAACLAAARRPDGFRFPGCGHEKGWELSSKPFTWDCSGCGRQTSVVAGTVIHGSTLALTVGFCAHYRKATNAGGISAVHLMRQLGLGSDKTALLLCAKRRTAMVAPDRNPLVGIAEIDETTIPYRTGTDPVADGRGRSGDGKMLVTSAVEVVDSRSGRVHLAAIPDFSAASLHAFGKANVAPGTTARTDGWPVNEGVPRPTHAPHDIGPMVVHVALPCSH